MYEFTSESVSSGHPDKIADKISDAVATYLIDKNININSSSPLIGSSTDKIQLITSIGSNVLNPRQNFQDL